MKFSALSRSKFSGFTLVELLVVIAIVGIIFSISILSLLSFNQRQRLTTATNELYAALQSAKSRAQSQVKPAQGICASNTLKGYNLVLQNSPTSPCRSGTAGCFYLYPVCTQPPLTPTPTQVRDISQGITVNSQQTFMFTVLSGTVPQAGVNGTDIILSNSSGTNTIRVFRDGRITISQ